MLTPQLIPATRPAHPVDTRAAPDAWGLQEVASARMTVLWHWTLLPACAMAWGLAAWHGAWDRAWHRTAPWGRDVAGACCRC